MITIRNLRKRFDPEREILSGVSLQIDEGELIAVLGISGSGKTTLLRCISLLDKWDDGQYIYKGKDISSPGWLLKTNMRKQIAYLEEKPVLFGTISALKNTAKGLLVQAPFWRRYTGLLTKNDHLTAMDYLEKVGLIDKGSMIANKLSGGEQQRVAIAKALAQHAEIIIADEPVSGLDPHAAERVMNDFKSICMKEQVAVICSLHNLELAERFATRIIILSQGHIVLDIKARRLTQKERDLVL